MTSKIKMWGNSLGVRIPKHVSEELDLEEGSDVQVSFKGGVIIIKPVGEKRETLRALVRSITRENCHKETDWGPPQGKEVW